MTALKKSSVFVTATVLAALLLAPISTLHAAIFEPGFESTTVATGFTLPTAMAFSQDGRIFVSEKGGAVRVVQNGVVLPTPVITLTDINTFGDRGLLGIATDPNFASNGYLYLSYTYENTPGSNIGGPKTGRIVRVTVVGNIAEESSKVVIVGTHGGTAAAPSCEDVAVTTDCIPSDSLSHSMGGLRFGPDGKLYATLGDGANFDYADIRSQRAQNVDSLAGKMLRVNSDGTAPTDNPFYNGDPTANRSKVYVMGLRNSFRLNFSPLDGALFSSDVGWSNWEEINRITSGANYGWPCWEGAATTTHNCTASTPVTNPLYHYAHNQFGAGSVTAGSFPANNAYPDEYDRSFFFGDYAQNWIKRLVLNENNEFVSVQDFMDDPNGPVDLSTGPDGNIYYLAIYTGDLNVLTHTTGNRRPVVQMNATPTAGLTPLTVNFSSAGTVDPDGDALTYLWNFGDGATSALANPDHTYTVNGSYQASVTVTDVHGSSNAKNLTITAGNQAPVANITSPANGSLYVPGDIITLHGEGTDLEDGTLPASAFSWDVILHHNTHTHMVQEFNGTKDPFFVAPDHSASDVYTEIVLTVTDSTGLTATKVLNLYLDNGSGVEGNLIQNPSVEIVEDGPSGMPLGWLQGWYGVLNPTFTYPVAGLEGNKALKVTVSGYSSGNAKWYFSPVSVTGGQTYIYGNDYQSDVFTSAFAQIGMSDGTYQYQNLGDFPPAATTTHIQGAVVVPVGAQSLTIWHEIYQNGELITDNFSLVLQPDNTDTTAPAVTVTAPADGATVSGAVALTADAADASGIAGVSFRIDDVQVGDEDTTAPYAFNWNTATTTNGTHTIAAFARDTAGNTKLSSPVTVTVSNSTTTPPAINFIGNPSMEIEGAGGNPDEWSRGGWGTNTSTFTYPVSGYHGAKASRVEVTSYTDGDAKWYFAPRTVTSGEQYTFSHNYRSNVSTQLVAQYTLATGPLQYAFLGSLPASTNWATSSMVITAPASATNVTVFHMLASTGWLETDNFSLTSGSTTPPVDTIAPIVAITSPAASSTVSGVTTITASSTDAGGVAQVQFVIDGVATGTPDTTAPYSFSWNTASTTNGNHTISAVARDVAGNTATATPITVTVSNTVGTTTPPATNLIPNPSLETASTTAGFPDQWNRSGWGTNNRAFTYPVAGIDGTDAARVEITTFTDGDAKWWFNPIAVTPGQTFTLSHQYRSAGASELDIRYTRTNGTFQYAFLGQLASTSNWTTDTYQVTVPAGVTHMTVMHILESAGWVEVDNYSLTSGTTTPPTDTMAPIVAITAPAASSTVSGVVSVMASSTDAVGVAGVKFLIDGIQAGTEDTTAPYAFSWNTASTTNGNHALSAVARDAAGNVATATPIIVTVSNAAGTTTPNLIANPSLEIEGTVGNPADWTRGGWGTNNRTYTYPTTGIHGAKAAKIEITAYTDGDAKWFFNPIPVTPGQVYTFSHQYKSVGASELDVRYTKTAGGFQYAFLAQLPAASNWTAGTYQITVPAGVTHMTMLHILESAGSVEMDNYSLTLGTSTPPADTTAPVVAISAPAASSTVASTTTITATATDAGGVAGVQFLIDGVFAGSEDTTAPYEYVWNTASTTNGTHDVSARARDIAGNVATATPVTVTVNNVVVSTNLIVNGDFEQGTSTPTAWNAIGWGNHTRVFTYPIEGRNGGKAARVQITDYPVGGDGDSRWEPNNVAVTPGTTYRYSDYYRAGTISDIIGRYTFADGSKHYFGIIKELPATTTWERAEGTFTPPVNTVSVSFLHLISTATTLDIDDAELVAIGTSTPAETEPPVASFITPVASSTVSGIVTLNATATDNVGVVALFFAVNGSPVGPMFSSAPYTYNWNTTGLADGNYVLKVTATDAAGNNSATSITVTVNNTNPPVDTTAPAVAITAPTNGSTASSTVTISATSTDNVAIASVAFFIDGVQMGIADSTAPYEYVWNTASSTNGAHSLAAVATDTSGNIATSSAISVTVDNATPVVSLIPNPSFELAAATNTPESWTASVWGTNTTTFTYPVIGPAGQGARIDMSGHVEGDAKWAFASIAVASSSYYTFTHAYRSDVQTDITVQYTLTDGTFQYVNIAAPLATNEWKTITQTFVTPANAVSMSIFHSLNKNGWLEVDEYMLAQGNLHQFSEGLVTLSFDDGWPSHYTAALPILNAANMKGTFYIVSQESLNAVSEERIVNADFETANGANPANWSQAGWGTNTAVFTYPALGYASTSGAKVEFTEYTDGDAKWISDPVTVLADQQYVISGAYNSTIPSDLTVQYTLSDGTFQYQFVKWNPSSNDTWQTFSEVVTTPATATHISVFQFIYGVGSLTTDNFSVKRVPDYTNMEQVLAIQASGHEIGSHTQTHPALAEIDPVLAQGEIENSRTDLLNNGVNAVTTIAYPFGNYNTNVQNFTEGAGYAAGRSVDRGFNTKATDKYALKIQQVDRTTTMADIQQWVTEAINGKTWLILMYHQIDNDMLQTLGVTPEFLQQNVDYIASTGAEVITVAEGVALMDGETLALAVPPTPPTPPAATQCADGIDNDGDGTIDLSDVGCETAEDNDEFNTIIVSGPGTFSVSLDASSPEYHIESGGTFNETLAELRFTGTDEALRIERVALQMNSASSSADNMLMVTLWDGVTQVGSASFVGSSYATSTLVQPFIIPANGSKILSIKADLADVGFGSGGTQGALIKVDYDNDDSTGTQAVGLSSGVTISRTSTSDTQVAGVRVFRSHPLFGTVAAPTTALTNSTVDLHRFSITADNGDNLSIKKVTADIGISEPSAANGTTTLTNLRLYAYVDNGYSIPVPGFSDGLVVIAASVQGETEFIIDPTALNIPAGTTHYFRIIADVAGTPGTNGWHGSVTTKLMGDSAYPSLATLMGTYAQIDADLSDNFVWSPNTNTMATAVDWTNGYAVVGLPATGTGATVISN